MRRGNLQPKCFDPKMISARFQSGGYIYLEGLYLFCRSARAAQPTAVAMAAAAAPALRLGLHTCEDLEATSAAAAASAAAPLHDTPSAASNTPSAAERRRRAISSELGAPGLKRRPRQHSAPSRGGSDHAAAAASAGGDDGGGGGGGGGKHPLQVEFARGNKAGDYKIHVNRLSKSARAKDVREIFKVFGELKYVKILSYEGGGSKGSAFVVFAHEADAQMAVAALGAAGRHHRRATRQAPSPPVSPAAAAARAFCSQIDGAVAPSPRAPSSGVGPAAAAAAYVPPHARRGRSVSDSATTRTLHQRADAAESWRKPVRLNFENGRPINGGALVNSPVFDGLSEPGEEAPQPSPPPPLVLATGDLPPSVAQSHGGVRQRLLEAGAATLLPAQATSTAVRELLGQQLCSPLRFGWLELCCACCLTLFVTTAALRLQI